MTTTLRAAFFVTVVLGSSSLAMCQLKTIAPANSKPEPPPAPMIIRLSVTPAAESSPALKYALLPRLQERKPGNAVPFYYRAIQWYTRVQERTIALKDRGEKVIDVQFDEWQSTPLDKLPKKEMQEVLNRYSTIVFEQIQIAAHREECNWDWRLEDMEGTKSISFGLDEIQQSRGIARYLCAKARLEIAEGRYDDALETLRLGYQMARDVGQPPIYICGLVGLAIGSILNDQLETLIDAPGSPNLYWALTELPRPFIDVRPANEYELGITTRVFPFLKNPETTMHTPQKWGELISDAIANMAEYNRGRTSPHWESRLTTVGMALKGYTTAKQELLQSGYDRETLDKMPVGQVLAIQEARIIRYMADSIRKWTLIESPESQKRIKEAEEELRREGYLASYPNSRETIPVASFLMPAISQANESIVRRETDFAAYRVIEALRMYAAEHDGRLPKSLADVHMVPVPNHPRTNAPFPYRLEGNKAILEVRRSTTPPAPMDQVDKIYEITIDTAGQTKSDRGKN